MLKSLFQMDTYYLAVSVLIYYTLLYVYQYRVSKDTIADCQNRFKCIVGFQYSKQPIWTVMLIKFSSGCRSTVYSNIELLAHLICLHLFFDRIAIDKQA